MMQVADERGEENGDECEGEEEKGVSIYVT